MKNYIITTNYINTNKDFIENNNGKIFIFAKENEQIPIKACQTLLELNHESGVDISFVTYNNKDELLLRLGMILEKQNEYYIQEDILIIPKEIEKEYNITKLKKQKTKRSVVNKTANTKVDTEKTIKEQSKKEIKKEPEKVNKKLSASTETVKEVKNALKQSGEIKERKDFGEKIDYFIKQMAVRKEDLKTSLDSNQSLAYMVADILNASPTSQELKENMQKKFGEDDSKTILKWITPNVIKLRSLAKELR